MKNINFIHSAEEYVQRFNLECTPEILFAEFKAAVEIHGRFDNHLHNSGLIKKLSKMERNPRLKERRRLFAEWYIQQNQNNKIMKEMLHELSDIAFVSTRTIEKDLCSEATVKHDRNNG